MAGRHKRVVWTLAARDALDEALTYIAQDSQSGAVAVLEQALAAADALATLSERGRIVPELRDPSIREIFVYNYRLLYEVTDTEVRIVAFVHGARDFGGGEAASKRGLTTRSSGRAAAPCAPPPAPLRPGLAARRAVAPRAWLAPCLFAGLTMPSTPAASADRPRDGPPLSVGVRQPRVCTCCRHIVAYLLIAVALTIASSWPFAISGWSERRRADWPRGSHGPNPPCILWRYRRLGMTSIDAVQLNAEQSMYRPSLQRGLGQTGPWEQLSPAACGVGDYLLRLDRTDLDLRLDRVGLPFRSFSCVIESTRPRTLTSVHAVHGGIALTFRRRHDLAMEASRPFRYSHSGQAYLLTSRSTPP